jgi:hypothetical protein
VKYFGFYWISDVATNHASPASWVDYLDEVVALGCTNIVHCDIRWLFGVSPWGPPSEEIIVALKRFLDRTAAANQKVIVGLDYLSLPNTTPDAAWNAALPLLHNIFDGRTNIYGFYFDEPEAAVQAVYRARTQQLRNEFPNVSVMTILAGPAMGDYSPDYFEFTTDLGMDYYRESAGWSFAAHDTIWKQVEETASRGQKLWLVPQMYVPRGDSNPTPYFSQLFADLNSYRDFGLGRVPMEGMLPFLYSPAPALFALTLRDAITVGNPLYSASQSAEIVETGRQIVAQA